MRNKRLQHRQLLQRRRGCKHDATLVIAGAEQVLCPICGASWQAEPLPWVTIVDGMVRHNTDIELRTGGGYVCHSA